MNAPDFARSTVDSAHARFEVDVVETVQQHAVVQLRNAAVHTTVQKMSDRVEQTRRHDAATETQGSRDFLHTVIKLICFE